MKTSPHRAVRPVFSLPLPPGEGRGEGAPRAFTLVELLVVVAIMSVLAAIITPAVLRARSAARNAAIKVEIDMLHMAIMNYKNEYGSFPPADSPAFSSSSPAFKHLSRLFPRCIDIEEQFAGVAVITPQTAMGFWLSGYTSDPMSPLRPSGGRRRLYDFDQSRLVDNSYFPSRNPKAPYIYINAANYLTSPTEVREFTGLAGGTYFAHRVPQSLLQADFADANQPAFNPDTFQILCAGPDGIFGTDDDLSNFWNGTRGDYLNSLR